MLFGKLGYFGYGLENWRVRFFIGMIILDGDINILNVLFYFLKKVFDFINKSLFLVEVRVRFFKVNYKENF